MIKKSKNVEVVLKYALLALTIVGVFFAVRYAMFNMTKPKEINVYLMLPFIVFLTPYLFLSLYSFKKVESKMQVVPRFLRDIVDNVESGMDLISAIKNTANNEYTVLNEDINKLVNQLSWGVDFEEAMNSFANNVGSVDLKRDFLLVIEARKVGGHVEKILRELSQKISVDNLRAKERKTSLASNTFTGYISFIIFIFIIILVYNSLFIGISENIEGIQKTGDIDTDMINDGKKMSTQSSIYLTLLILLSYELAILSGFLFGLMQAKSIISGGPHVVVLITITFIGFYFIDFWPLLFG